MILRRTLASVTLLVVMLAGLPGPAAATGSEAVHRAPVVLLHGLLRSSSSMSRLAASLSAAGYDVCNVAYPSRRHSIEVLAQVYVAPEIARCFPGSTEPIHFVTHSMGGIVVRQLASMHLVATFGRVVMLAPPNHGSELVDEFGGWWLFRQINGPAGEELGTSVTSVPMRLGPATFELGIITGDRTTNPLFSAFLPHGNDGKVSVASAKLDGMKDFLVIPVSHTFIMRNVGVIAQTIRFLERGEFSHELPRRRGRVIS